MEYFVSKSGHDGDVGSLDRPFRTVARGLEDLGPGDILNLRHGVYLESVDIAAKHGTADAPIVIRSYPGEHAYLDGSLLEFRRPANRDWVPAQEFDLDAAEDEYVSTHTFAQDSVNRGAFLDRNPYTRLISYSRLEDLRASNQTFERLTEFDPARPGPQATDDEGNSLGFFYPWSYMGPGLWFNPLTRRVHIRLAHTTNHVPGVVDYLGEVDPRRVPLAITPRGTTTARIRGSSHLRLEHLTVRFGGRYTVQLQASHQVVFDHVRLLASTIGIRIGGSVDNPATDIAFQHCEFRGGVPTWYFRNDRKTEYDLVVDGEVVHNGRGSQTSDRLMYGNPNNANIEISHSEFLNAHDLFLHGQGVDFHHNWVHNLQDEGLYLDDFTPDNPTSLTRIHENVITQTLSALSFSGRNETIRWLIYRNLIDLRRPTAGYRPRRPGDTDVWRYGHFYKSDPPDGPVVLFQNTFLVYDQRSQASFMHYRETTGSHYRGSFNNLFVSVNPSPQSDRAITFVPSPSFPGPTDGNCYHRIGYSNGPAFRYLGYSFDGGDFPGNGTFQDLGELRESLLFQQSQGQYPPGYEAASVQVDPRFRSIAADGHATDSDDLRLASDSLAIGAGAALQDHIADLDPFPPDGNPDIGCYPQGAEPLRVGVNSRRVFPRFDE